MAGLYSKCAAHEDAAGNVHHFTLLQIPMATVLLDPTEYHLAPTDNTEAAPAQNNGVCMLLFLEVCVLYSLVPPSHTSFFSGGVYTVQRCQDVTACAWAQ